MKVKVAGWMALVLLSCAWAGAQVTPSQEISCTAQQTSKPDKIEVSFPESAHAGPITGRVFVVLARQPDPDPREQIGSWTERTPYFGEDVSQ